MTKRIKPLTDHCGQRLGHPMYFATGGDVPTPKQMLAKAIDSDYRGYKEEEFSYIGKMSEPRRSEKLLKWKSKFKQDYKSNLSEYRKAARELRQHRIDNLNLEQTYTYLDVYTRISLSYRHLYTDLAHLAFLEELLSEQNEQLDLFG